MSRSVAANLAALEAFEPAISVNSEWLALMDVYLDLYLGPQDLRDAATPRLVIQWIGKGKREGGLKNARAFRELRGYLRRSGDPDGTGPSPLGWFLAKAVGQFAVLEKIMERQRIRITQKWVKRPDKKGKLVKANLFPHQLPFWALVKWFRARAYGWVDELLLGRPIRGARHDLFDAHGVQARNALNQLDRAARVVHAESEADLALMAWASMQQRGVSFPSPQTVPEPQELYTLLEPTLSRREREYLQARLRGLTPTEAAAAMHISRNTADVYWYRINQKRKAAGL
jgi:DNA-binding CsgD family transcriptional regulator